MHAEGAVLYYLTYLFVPNFGGIIALARASGRKTGSHDGVDQGAKSLPIVRRKWAIDEDVARVHFFRERLITDLSSRELKWVAPEPGLKMRTPSLVRLKLRPDWDNAEPAVDLAAEPEVLLDDNFLPELLVDDFRFPVPLVFATAMNRSPS